MIPQSPFPDPDGSEIDQKSDGGYDDNTDRETTHKHIDEESIDLKIITGDGSSDSSHVHEMLIEEIPVHMVENTPTPPPSWMPPLYASVMSERRKSQIETNMFSNERNTTDDYRGTQGRPMGPGGQSQTTGRYDSYSNSSITGDEYSLNSHHDADERHSEHGERTTATNQYDSDTDAFPMSGSSADLRRVENRHESNSDTHLSFESTGVQESVPTPNEDLMQQRKLPTPNTTSYRGDTLDVSSSSREYSRRTSESYGNENRLQQPIQQTDTMTLPQVESTTTTASSSSSSSATQQRRVSTTRPVEITLPRDTWTSIQDGSRYRDNSYYGDRSGEDENMNYNARRQSGFGEQASVGGGYDSMEVSRNESYSRRRSVDQRSSPEASNDRELFLTLPSVGFIINKFSFRLATLRSPRLLK